MVDVREEEEEAGSASVEISSESWFAVRDLRTPLTPLATPVRTRLRRWLSSGVSRATVSAICLAGRRASSVMEVTVGRSDAERSSSPDIPRRRCTAAFASETFESRLARNSRTENAACAAPPPVTPGADAFDPSSARGRGGRGVAIAPRARAARASTKKLEDRALLGRTNPGPDARDAFDAARAIRRSATFARASETRSRAPRSPTARATFVAPRVIHRPERPSRCHWTPSVAPTWAPDTCSRPIRARAFRTNRGRASNSAESVPPFS